MLFVRKVKEGYIVVNKVNGKHTHFKRKDVAYCFVRLMKKRILPNRPYLQESARRVLSRKEYRSLKKAESIEI